MRTLALATLLCLPTLAHGQTAPPMAHEHKPAVRAESLAVTVAGRTTTFSATELAAMPQTSLTVVNGHSRASETYTGVAVGELLKRCGLSLAEANGKAVYHSVVRAEGTDGYWVMYSASELEGDLRAENSLIALAVDGKPLGEDGAFKLVEGGEKKPARWVRNLSVLKVSVAD